GNRGCGTGAGGPRGVGRVIPRPAAAAATMSTAPPGCCSPRSLRRSARAASSRRMAAAEGSNAVALPPGEPGDGVADRIVFAANPARIPELVDAAEDELPPDLSGADRRQAAPRGVR